MCCGAKITHPRYFSNFISKYNEEILVIDPATNTYLSSSAFDTESKQRTYESVNILMDKLQTQFIWP